MGYCTSKACLVLMAALLLASLAVVSAQSKLVEVNWVRFSNPSAGVDEAYGVCVCGDYVFVVGVDGAHGEPELRVEKRLKSDGELADVWAYNPGLRDRLVDCVAAGNRVYAVGWEERRLGDSQWIILVFDLDLNLLNYVTSNPSSSWDYAYAVACDGKYLYIAGCETVDVNKGDVQWRVEKRRLDDLSLAAVYTSNPTSSWDEVYDVEVNPVTGHLWLVGHAHREWRIELVDGGFNLVKAVEPHVNFECYAVTFDSEGNAYAVGALAMVKLDKEGRVLKRIDIDGFKGGEKAVMVNGYLCVAGYGYVDGYDRHILYLFDKQLNLVDKTVLSSDINASSYFGLGEVVHDGGNVFLAGFSSAAGNTEWVIYSIKATSQHLVMTTIALIFMVAAIMVSALLILKIKARFSA